MEILNDYRSLVLNNMVDDDGAYTFPQRQRSLIDVP